MFFARRRLLVSLQEQQQRGFLTKLQENEFDPKTELKEYRVKLIIGN